VCGFFSPFVVVMITTYKLYIYRSSGVKNVYPSSDSHGSFFFSQAKVMF